MPQWIIKLLANNYDEQHGVVNSRPVLDAVLKDSVEPFRDVLDTFGEAPRQWRLPLVDAMRTLAATGHCTAEEALSMLEATRTVVVDAGDDEEYFKTVNAMVSAPAPAPAVVTFVLSLLREADDFQRRLAFYAVALLADKRTAALPDELRAQLKAEAAREPSLVRRRQFFDVLARL